MYLFLARLLFMVTTFLLVVSPLVALTAHKSTSFFLVLWLLLYINQMLMYEIGADVSPYAYATSQINAVRFLGLTLSALASIAIALYVFSALCFQGIRIPNRSLIAMLLVLLPTITGLMSSTDIRGELDSFLKTVLPFLIAIYLEHDLNDSSVELYKRFMTVINIVIVVQVALCKLFTGHFAAYNYYHEMPEEYFGFFNHPHVFTGLLAITCIWNIYSLHIGRQPALNCILFGTSAVLLFISGVRTYPVALAAGLLYLGVVALGSSRLSNIRWLSYLGLFAVLIAGSFLLNRFGSGRITGDFSSGRLERWTQDLLYFNNHYSPFEKAFGRGIGSVEKANSILFGVSINSLNLWIDLLLDYGIVGMLLMTAAYIYLFAMSWQKGSSEIQKCIGITFLVTCLINSVVSYVPIMSMMIVLLFVIKTEGSVHDESTGTQSATVPRNTRKQRVVGSRLY